VPGLPRERHPDGTDAAVCEHRLALCRLGDDRFAEAMIAGEERGDAARIVRFFVRREQERRIALCHLCGRHECRGRALDVAGTQADRAIAFDAQRVRIGAPCRRRRHGVQMHVEHALGLPAHREQRDRTGAMVDDLDLEIRQLRAQVVEDAAGTDVAGRVAGVERHQRFEVLQRAGEQVGHAGSLFMISRD
jgi:hypothetical protein